MRALVAASHADVAEWLTHAGYAQYAGTLARLGGAALLLQTEASLMAAGVAAQDAALLLACIAAAASDALRTPPTDEPDAHAAR